MYAYRTSLGIPLPDLHSPELEAAASRRWIAKAIKAAWYQNVVTAADLKPFEGMTQDQVIAKLFDDPKFYLRVVDFNLYYFGSQTEDLFDFDAEFSLFVNAYPAAIHGAHAISQGRAHTKLWDYQIPFLAPPLNPREWNPATVTYLGITDRNEFESLEAFDLRRRVLYAYRNHLLDLEAWVNVGNAPKVCETIRAKWMQGNLLDALRDAFGLPNVIRNRSGLESFFIFQEQNCQDYILLPFVEEQVTSSIAAIDVLAENLDQFLIRNDPTTYDLSQFRYLPFFNSDFPEGEESALTITGFWRKNLNSSTNFNRRRAAEILKTYFCDDLIPVGGLEIPSQHTQGRHGSEPSCQACHYKLDPMAGFFKDHSFFGISIPSLPLELKESLKSQFDVNSDEFFVFDDNLVITDDQVSEYFANWIAPEGSERDWNIGYIRSETATQLNRYGESLEDLFRIVAAAPEAKTCMVRRMAEFYIDSEQTYSGAWLDKLAKQYSHPQGNGFKNTLKTILKSEAFAAVDRDPTTCYDTEVSPGESTAPCEIAWIVETSCSSCHNTNAPLAELDLTTWLENEGEWQFSHKKQGKLLSAADSFQIIMERISHSNPNLRMPIGTHMSSTDRQTFFVWLEQQLSR